MVSGSRKSELYEGQKLCPVSGDQLGSRGPALPVETGVGARKPSFIGKLFGRKPTPGIVVYACCPECAAQVKKNPDAYVTKMIAEVNGWSNESSAVKLGN